MADGVNTIMPFEARELKFDNSDIQNVHVRGKPKSGRVWKRPRERFSSTNKTRGGRLRLEQKQKLAESLKRIKEQSRAIIEKINADREAKKQRRIENLKRAQENQRKSEIVQVIQNTAKLKLMNKKQLRKIEKRDTINMQKK